MIQQRAPDAVPTLFRPDIRMANQRHVLHILNPHDAQDAFVDLAAVEAYALGDFGFQLCHRHVGLVPTICRDHAFVGERGLVDDLEDDRQIALLRRGDLLH